jgi:hypothetical protein
MLFEHQLGEFLNDGTDEQRHPLPIKFLKHSPAGPSCYLLSDPKSVASRRARLRLDRSGLNDSRFRRRLTPSPLCPDCKVYVDTPEHVLLHCPHYDQTRQTVRSTLSRYGLQLDFALAMGDVEGLPSTRLQKDTLSATALLLSAINRISARRS